MTTDRTARDGTGARTGDSILGGTPAGMPRGPQATRRPVLPLPPRLAAAPLMALALLLAACARQGAAPPAPAEVSAEQLAREDLRAEILDGDAPAPATPGACWVRDVLPARLESVTEQVPVAQPAPGQTAGAPARAPAGAFRSETRQQIVQDRRAVRFAVPCPGALLDIATLQRALKVRGYYAGPVTGRLGMALAQAVRRYQAARGLDSAILSLAAARQLGLAAVPRDPAPGTTTPETPDATAPEAPG